MRKTLAMGLTIAVTMGLAACGSSTSSTAGTADSISATEKPAAAATSQADTAATSAAAAAASTVSAAPVTISYCNFNASGGNEETLNKMYEAFHKENPDITVNIETIGYDDYFTQMQTRVAGGTAPDCYELNIENFAAYSSKGVLAPITGVDTGNFNQTALQAFQVDGTQYGLPGDFSNVVLIYNKDLFDKAGVDYPTSDWTWDDALAAAKKIRALGDDYWGIYAPTTYNEFFKEAAQYGGSLLNEDKTEFTINSDNNLKAAEMMIGKVTDSHVQPSDTDLAGMGDSDLFESGRLGMDITGIWMFSTFKDACDFNWDCAVEPGGTQKATHFFSNALVINASADADKQAAAAKWINWLASSDESAKMRIAASWNLPAISNTDVLADYLKQTPPDNRQAVFDSLNYLVTPPIIEDYSQMSDIINEKLSEAASGKITPKDALDQAQQECQEKITLK
ncbi:MAG: sugar ABC transporter substrate-binding protein [Lachnospiraceae bacterium]|nr:sugar ABC transporter substrate-binding protein [Lachnospiraceae bacterium]